MPVSPHADICLNADDDACRSLENGWREPVKEFRLATPVRDRTEASRVNVAVNASFESKSAERQSKISIKVFRHSG